MTLCLHDPALRRLRVAVLLVAFFAGCRGEAPLSELSNSAAPASPAGPSLDPAAQMTIAVGEVSTTPQIAPEVIRAPLREAEAALLSCIDADGSTGVVAMNIALEGDGFVGRIRLRDRTTYGDDEARACVLRIIGALRFPSTGLARVDVDVALEIHTRHASP